MLGWLNEHYNGDTARLHSTYEIANFKIALIRDVIRALVIILKLKIKIEVEVGVVRMAYAITQAHVCYDFMTFLSIEIK